MNEKSGRVDPPKRRFNKNEVPRTFMSPAFVEESSPGEFLMFREVLIETDQLDSQGKPIREKFGKRIGPMMRLTEAQKGESIDFTTSRPDGTVLLLHRVFPTEMP